MNLTIVPKGRRDRPVRQLVQAPLLGAALVVAAVLGASPSCSSEDPPPPVCVADTQELYERRIEPIFTDDNPKSCNQCHLSGVDLGQFVRKTPCETLACLRDLELVDLDDPEESQVLSWIGRAEPDSELITQEVIDAEREGLLDWIEANAACPEACGDAKCGEPSEPETCEITRPTEDAGAPSTSGLGCDDLSMEQLFYDGVYQWRRRCYPCHVDTLQFADDAAPRWMISVGNCDSASLATMRMILAGGYVDVDEPEQSLLLLKPLAEAAGGVQHGGHDKFANHEDLAYQGFLTWIEHYASCEKTGTGEPR